MHESSLGRIRCVRCGNKLALEALKKDAEIIEGILSCTRCDLQFPIVGKIPILWDGLANYLANRPRLGGMLYSRASSPKLKQHIKKSLGVISRTNADASLVEKRWSSIYEKNKGSAFYRMIKKSLPSSGVVLEHGCSIGIVTGYLSKQCDAVFGIDKSYHALEIAKKSASENLDYFVADSLSSPFGGLKFDCVVGLNLFEIIEPRLFLKLIARQVKKGGLLVLSDPYDFERGEKSVREPLYGSDIRDVIEKSGFAVSRKTKKPSFHLWNLKLHDRAKLEYRVDLILAKKLR